MVISTVSSCFARDREPVLCIFILSSLLFRSRYDRAQEKSVAPCVEEGERQKLEKRKEFQRNTVDT